MSLLNLVGFAAAISLTGVGPLAVAVWARARLRLPLRMFFIGAAFYLVQLVAQQPVWLGVRATGSHDAFLLAAVVGPAVYALFEESSRYLSWRAGRSMRDNRTSNGALLAGLGHGGMESIVFTLQPIGAILVALVAPRSLPSGLAHQLLYGPNLAFYATMVGGRALAMATHLGFAHLSLLAYRRSVLFLPLAVLAHFGVDCSVFGVLSRLGQYSPVGWALFAAWAAASILLVAHLRSTWLAGPEQPLPMSTDPSPMHPISRPGFCGPRSWPGGHSLRSSAPNHDLKHLDAHSDAAIPHHSSGR